MATMGGLAEVAALSRWAARLSSPRSTAAGSGVASRSLRHAAVHLEGADRGDDHDGRGVEARRAALEVEELLAAEVEGEARLGHGVVGRGPGPSGWRGPSCSRGRCWRTGRRGRTPASPSPVWTRLGRIASLRIAAIAPVTPELGRGHRLPSRVGADEDAVEPGAQVGRRVGQAEDRHDLAGRRDVEPRLARARPACGRPGRSTISRKDRSFMSSARFQSTRRGSSRRSSPKWSRLSIAAASRLWAAVIAWKSPVNWRLIVVRRLEPGSRRRRSPPLAAEDRAHRGLPQRQARPLADLRQPLGQADRGRRLPLAGRRRRDRRDQDQLARRPAGLPGPPGGPWPCRRRRARRAGDRFRGRGRPRRWDAESSVSFKQTSLRNSRVG